MGAFYDDLPDGELRDWLLDQKIFWVATAPLHNEGHVNVSPKGMLCHVSCEIPLNVHTRPAFLSSRRKQRLLVYRHDGIGQRDHKSSVRTRQRTYHCHVQCLCVLL